MTKKIFSNGLIKNTIVLFIMLNLFNFLNLIYHFIIARLLSPTEYGILISLFSLIYIFNVPFEAIQNISSKITSKLNVKNEKGKIKYFIKRSINKAIKYSFIIFAGIILISFFLSKFLNINIELIILTGGMIFFFTVAPIPRGVLQGRKKFIKLGITFVLEGILKVFLSAFFVIIGWKVFGAIFGIALAVLSAFVISVFFIKDILKEKEEKDHFKNIYSFSTPFFVTTLVVFSMISIDILLTRRFFSPDSAGKYAVVSMLGKMIFFATVAIGKTMFSESSQNHEEKRATSNILKKSSIIMGIVSGITLFIFLLIPKFVILLTFGPKYLEIAPLIIFSGIAFTLLSFSNMILLYGLAIHKLKGKYFLLLFIFIQILLLSIFNSNLREYLLALIVSNIIMLLGSVILVRK